MLLEGIPGIEPAAAPIPHAVTVCVGGVSLILSGDSPRQTLLGPDLEEFRIEGSDPDIVVSVDWSENLRSLPRETVFDSGAIWTLAHDGSDFVFDFASPVLGPHPYKRLRADRTFRTAQLTLNRTALDDFGPICPLEYPADELLVTNYLARHRLGIEVHGCGLIDSVVGGQLLLGHSGAGKSTTTRIWKELRNPTILSDDRLILRLDNGGLHMYGTPWHGEAAFAEQGYAKLNRIFILQHGPRNSIRLLPRTQAAGEVFARSFPPFHSSIGIDGVLEFIDRVVGAVPCYEFQFVPDESAVDAVLNFHD